VPLDDPRGVVQVGTAVPTTAWASALVDDEEADVIVSAAATALGAAAAGDVDAAFAVEEADATELGWWAVQELPHLLT
jgi:2C-methyl-D-erythritol 2,4-cyclodiphosphate synthase